MTAIAAIPNPPTMEKQVLLLDDNPIQLAARQRVLSTAGLEVHVATTAESALALLRSENFRSSIGMIVTDHIMPEVTGNQFVGMLREIAPEVPILVISGMAEAEEQYREFSNLEFRTKPVQPMDLIQLVRSKVSGS